LRSSTTRVYAREENPEAAAPKQTKDVTLQGEVGEVCALEAAGGLSLNQFGFPKGKLHIRRDPNGHRDSGGRRSEKALPAVHARH